jgi:hypothetical protein
VIVRDAGVLPKGETTTVRVRITNVYTVPLKVESQRPEGERARRAVVRGLDRLDPKQVGFIEVEIDTRGLDGESAVRVPFALVGLNPKSGALGEDPKDGRPFFSQAEMVIRFASR